MIQMPDLNLPKAPDRAAHISARGMLIQTSAMLLDAYRELNSKKMFWITMILSGLVVSVFAAVGFDEQGFSIFWKHINHALLNTRFLPKAQLYKNLFLELGVWWWLGFIALILALVSTAPMFPDFLSGGAVDLYLARPLGRTRLFLTKYVVGLLFISFQVAVFCFASFLVIGIRGGVWVPGVFLAIPVVVLIFSYLWSICAFFGTITRSTVASLLLTILGWCLIFGIHATESTLLRFSVGAQIEMQELDRDIQRFEKDIAALNANPATTQPRSFESARLWTLNASIERSRADRAKATDAFASWHKLAYAIKWPLPKMSETTALLERWLDRQFRAPRERRRESEDPDEARSRNFFRNPRVRQLTSIEIDRILRSRSAAWVIGTSLLFEAALLAWTTRIFSRKDY